MWIAISASPGFNDDLAGLAIVEDVEYCLVSFPFHISGMN